MTDFGGAGAAPGLEVWRIEKMEAVKVKEEKEHGTFYSGDCYLVLHTKKAGVALQRDLYFWLGKDSSQDEQGAAAYRTVELDDSLGGEPTQHREVQGHESNSFAGLFKKCGGLQYRDGGIDSAFNKVDRDAYEPRLFQLKGKRNVRVQQVACERASLNSGDVFVLDLGLALFQWNGSEANKYEKAKGLDYVTHIKNDERGGRAEIEFLDEGRNDDVAKFWDALGGKGAVKGAEEGGDDAAVKAHAAHLVRISDASGQMETTGVAEGSLKRDMLDTKDVFIVDSGSALFVWVGKGATKDEKRKGMEYGSAYLKEKGRPAWTPMTRVVEGAESPAFKALFAVWEPPRVLNFGGEAKVEREEVKVDVSALQKQVREAEEKMVDDGSGSVKVWRIEGMDRVEFPENRIGEFYAGDSFIVLYTYMKNGKPSWIIYFWQGRDSSQDEKAASALFAKQLDDEMGGDPVQVRVVQGKEPNHFLTLFKGRMVVHEGGVPSGFANRDDTDSTDKDGVSLFHVRGSSAVNTRAVQVAEKAVSLNSGDCFVLLSPKTMYVWQGEGANDDERKVAAGVADRLKGEREVASIVEGEEPDAFWEILGGKGEYPRVKTFDGEPKEPRLFVCSSAIAAGRGVAVEEVFDFTQDDLQQDDVMILDVWTEVFVWIGHGSTKEEQSKSLEIALDYIDAGAAEGRDKDTPVFRVYAGNEPPNFTCHFLGWDNAQASDFSDPYAAKLAALKENGEVGVSAGDGDEAKQPAAAAAPAQPERITRADVGFAKPGSVSYSHEELKAGTPKGVDPAHKELYLSDADHEKIFGMAKDAFAALPKWKRVQAKKKHGLF